MADNDKKMILVFPPQWTPVSPFYSLAFLYGQLKKAGYNAECMDLNVRFYNDILTKDYLEFINDKIKHDYLELFKNIRKIYVKEKRHKKYTVDEQCAIYKFHKIKEFMGTGNTYYERVPETIRLALGVIRSKELFYSPPDIIKAMNIVDYALKLISLAWSPMNIEFEACWHSFMKLNYESIRHFVFDKNSNIFWDFHRKRETVHPHRKDILPHHLHEFPSKYSAVPVCLSLIFLNRKYRNTHCQRPPTESHHL